MNPESINNQPEKIFSIDKLSVGERQTNHARNNNQPKTKIENEKQSKTLETQQTVQTTINRNTMLARKPPNSAEEPVYERPLRLAVPNSAVDQRQFNVNQVVSGPSVSS